MSVGTTFHLSGEEGSRRTLHLTCITTCGLWYLRGPSSVCYLGTPWMMHVFYTKKYGSQAHTETSPSRSHRKLMSTFSPAVTQSSKRPDLQTDCGLVLCRAKAKRQRKGRRGSRASNLVFVPTAITAHVCQQFCVCDVSRLCIHPDLCPPSPLCYLLLL